MTFSEFVEWRIMNRIALDFISWVYVSFKSLDSYAKEPIKRRNHSLSEGIESLLNKRIMLIRWYKYTISNVRTFEVRRFHFLFEFSKKSHAIFMSFVVNDELKAFEMAQEAAEMNYILTVTCDYWWICSFI